MTFFTLRGLAAVRRDQIRRARGERSGRFPVKVSTRLSGDVWRAVERAWEDLAPDLTCSEFVRILIEYAAVWAVLREDLERNLSEM